MQLHQRIGIFFIMSTLAGCATVTTTPISTEKETIKAQTWAEREAALSKIKAWQINGKIAVRTPKDSGSANVDWQQSGGSYNIDLTGPLGSNSMKLKGRPGAVTMTTSKGERFSASSPEELLGRQWGFNVPVSNLKYWVRGLPAPGGANNQRFDEANRLSSFTQNGWHVQYPSYTSRHGVDLPSKVFITSSALDVKIVIYNWQMTT